MKILTWDTPNFGDRLNDLIWPHFIPELLDDDGSQALVGVGSLLNHRLPAAPIKWILGAGVGHGDPPTVDQTWRILWVRGPRSASILGLPDCRHITDGAALLMEMVKPAPKKAYPCAFIPHCSAVEQGAMAAMEEICREEGIHLINPHWPVQRVLAEIGRCERIITEALHGAIVADLFRIPWIPVARRGIHAFKWHDWSESMNLAYRPIPLPYRPLWLSARRHPRLSRRLAFTVLRPAASALLGRQLSALARHGPWQLSRDGLLEGKVEEMKACLASLQATPKASYGLC